jgi:hypothetical protein
MDDGLNYLKTNGNRIVLCAGQPASYAEATTNYPSGKALGHKAISSTDMALADGDTSGRKITVAQQTGITVDATGTCDHIAIVDTVGSALLLVTTVTGQVVTAGNTANVNAYKDEIAAPA